MSSDPTPERFLQTRGAARFAPEKLQKVNLFETPDLFCDVWGLEPGQEQKVHAHAGNTKFYLVRSGRGVFTVGEEERELGPGELAWSAPGEPHGVRNEGPERLELMVVMGPHPKLGR